MKVGELLADPAHWTKHAMARDAFGTVIRINSPNATCWCLLGAIRHCYKSLPDIDSICDRIYAELPRSGITSFNDNSETTHADIIAICNKLNI